MPIRPAWVGLPPFMIGATTARVLLVLGLAAAGARAGAQPAAMPAPEVEAPVKFALHAHDRVAFVGNSLAERMNLHGHLESLLHSRFPSLELVVRNFGWPGDEAGLQQRPDNYTAIDDPFLVFGANVFFCFFGYNESFAGRDGLPKF